MKSTEPRHVSALLTLLQDEDVKIASLAMEEFLKLGQAMEETIAEHQESQDPTLRQRIHQLSSILVRRRARMQFIEAMSQEQISLWDGACQINALYDPKSNTAVIAKLMGEVNKTLRSEPVTTPRVAALMREQEFVVPDQDVLDVDLYLIQRVLETRYGSPALLCLLAQHAAAGMDWMFTIVLHGGRFCLIDRNNLLLDPTEGWHISKLKAADRIHPCARRDVLLGILSQLFLVALVNGQLRDLYHFGDLLTALNRTGLDVLPYPLGDND
ncbi:MAG: hypothetical protein HN742_12005 [Lentisphaerae bacterium]|nr:hypothetical protein [Lentisphaerota bacterium]MBT4819298.1 hypothetical protein [Lentisphaerota bacterium]MBT5610550.1 hypothetical protein [Lentisphaerota bacterium]MBT7054422.1 hypothetical protein [Lentisphaerota bacterium]MBT7842591.1 hypothetical protein [Lentisphaerota bacterium]